MNHIKLESTYLDNALVDYIRYQHRHIPPLTQDLSTIWESRAELEIKIE